MRYTKLLILALVLVAYCIPQEAQAQRFKLPHWEGRVGLGLLPTFVKDETKGIIPPHSIEFRYRPAERFSLGILFGQSTSEGLRTHHTGEARFARNNFRTVGLRFAAHSNPRDPWEVYGGFSIAYNHNNIEFRETIFSKNEEDVMPTPPVRNGLTYTAFVGTSVAVKGNFRAFGEVGFGLSLLTVGGAYRF